MSPSQGRWEGRNKSLFYQGGQVGQECVALEVPSSSKQFFSNVGFGTLDSQSPSPTSHKGKRRTKRVVLPSLRVKEPTVRTRI